MDLVNIFVLAVGLVSVVTNGVLLFILIRDPLKCFKSSTTYFIISLSVSDLLTGMNACFMGLDKVLSLSPDHHRYLLSLFWITVQVSFLTLLAMSLERFLIVKYPIYCRVWITKKRVSFAVACIWSVSATVGGLVLLPPPHLDYVQFSIFCEFFLSVFVITGLYTFILFEIQSSKEKVKGTGQLHKGGSQAIRKTSSMRKTSSVRKMSPGKQEVYGIQITVTEEPNSSVSLTSMPAACPGSPRILSSHNTVNGAMKNGAVGEGILNGGKLTGGKNDVGKNAEGANTRKKSVEFHEESTIVEFNRGKPRRDFIKAAQNIMKSKEKSGPSQQDKLTAVVLLLVGILAVTILPYLLASQIILGYVIFCKCPPPQVLLLFHYYYLPIELLNFAVNPLVYAWRLPQYRRSLRYMCTKYQSYTETSQGWASIRSASSPGRREYTSQ
ncbi:cholecystokinin receptor type A-like [Dendronephthya gigantea]|uniref:cholecystokinin receptor type A-like n=1 Tax=Dendronephthya gigantea TaxID=151771 RepID=UPI0010694C30|nr:cholecystokinin receptor type A-like [Dendronephthya gigantea]XP_028402618.1 cholecystokinin receptor type A-like [Dendronephthya gigantea]XP_028402619.1 cholecystokinin receptor type A-like [Dendronephthya gigantea]